MAATEGIPCGGRSATPTETVTTDATLEERCGIPRSRTACTIVSGAMAERTKFVGYLIYAALLAGILYPLCGHWAWGSFGGAFGVSGTKGWLENMGFIGFAGSSVVHVCGGACALAGIIVIGPRHGRFAKDGTPRLIAGHNIALAALGVFILWFGWFGSTPAPPSPAMPASAASP